jgi:formylglycine-generating enzyme required for sulfatase activity
MKITVYSKTFSMFALLLAGCPDWSYTLYWIDVDIDAGSDVDVMSWKDAGIEDDSHVDAEADSDADVTTDAYPDSATYYVDSDTDGDADEDIGADADIVGEVPFGWELISGGTFTMGSPERELGRIASRERDREVTLTNDFIIQATEVTQLEFETRMGYNESLFIGCDSCPIENVNWSEAAAYCNALSRSESLALCYECDGVGQDVECSPSLSYSSPYDCPGYRLPTEAEWEYAARAGENAGTYNGNLDVEDCFPPSEVLNPIAWYCGNAGDISPPASHADGRTHPVGRLAANAWGLHDMLGNVFEWCHDRYVEDLGIDAVTDPSAPETESFRTVRGGGWNSLPQELRAAYREIGQIVDTSWGPASFFSPSHGIRPVRTIPAETTPIGASIR